MRSSRKREWRSVILLRPAAMSPVVTLREERGMERQLVAFFLAGVGLCGTVLICALPMWKVTPFVGANILTAQVFWEGLWMNCVLQSTGQMQCMPYESLLALSADLQGSRALVCASIGAGVAAACLSVVGGRCTNFYRRSGAAKARAGLAAGAVFVVAGLLCLVAVSWSAYVIITGFYSPQSLEPMKGELGASIYVGWVSGALLVIGGGMVCGSYASRCC
ncbi:claudin-4 [Denticeps clupeoides]|uniref:claudin-4 n=1 Tax=Denticeps clupeoides TaxID=299321 RepID=UPI0010A42574|nr:claudin-4-like [Denticeps clupeoides]